MQELNSNTELKSLNKDSYPEPKQVTPYVTLRDFAHFEELVLAWASDRNLLEGSTNLLQCKKLYEESHELLCNYIDGKDMRDDIGDNFVVLVQMFYRAGYKSFVSDTDYNLKSSFNSAINYYLSSLASLVGSCVRGDKGYSYLEIALHELTCYVNSTDLDLLECCEIAYNDIRDRKGQMIDGSFVKEV